MLDKVCSAGAHPGLLYVFNIHIGIWLHIFILV